MNKIEDNLEKNIEKINIPSKKNYIFSFIISLFITIIINNIFSVTVGNLISWIFNSEIVYSIFFSPVFKSLSLAICFRLSYQRFNQLNSKRIIYWLWMVAIMHTNYITLRINYSQESNSYSDFELIVRILLEILGYVFAINYLNKFFDKKD
jgi:phosphate/sulfate permease